MCLDNGVHYKVPAFFAKHLGRYFLCGVVHLPVAGALKPGSALFVKLVDVVKNTVTDEILFDKADDIFYPTLCLWVLLATHVNLEPALVLVLGKFLC